MSTDEYDEVIRYYEETTDEYLRYAGDTLSWHLGLWGPGIRNLRDAMLEANRILADGCGIGQGTRVLDAGCGVGGLAFYLAENLGARVCGINICEPHIELARKVARERGIDHLVEFHPMNYMELAFADGSFDVVLNQDSIGYASDMQAYFEGVRRVLRPGGRYRCLDGFRSGDPLGPEELALCQSIQRGWKVAALRTWQEVCAALGAAGLAQIAYQDVSQMAHPTARRILMMGREVMARPEEGPAMTAAWSDHTAAAMSFSTGLLRGVFHYMRLEGTKP
jgi:ubiquinone/menaquinone biosynthesis C-methylase UbiE